MRTFEKTMQIIAAGILTLAGSVICLDCGYKYSGLTAAEFYGFKKPKHEQFICDGELCEREPTLPEILGIASDEPYSLTTEDNLPAIELDNGGVYAFANQRIRNRIVEQVLKKTERHEKALNKIAGDDNYVSEAEFYRFSEGKLDLSGLLKKEQKSYRETYRRDRGKTWNIKPTRW